MSQLYKKIIFFSLLMLSPIVVIANSYPTIELNNVTVLSGSSVSVVGAIPYQVVTATCNTPNCTATAECPDGRVVYQGYAYSIIPNGGMGDNIKFCGFQSTICVAGQTSCSIKAVIQNPDCIKPAWLQQTTVVYVICHYRGTMGKNK